MKVESVIKAITAERYVLFSACPVGAINQITRIFLIILF